MSAPEGFTIDDRSGQVVITVPLEGRDADRLWSSFTEAEALTQWWPEEADIDLVVGGEYALRWPGPQWTLRGEYVEIVRSHRLSFTWRWDHEEMPDRLVEIDFSETDLVLSHTYGRTEERDGYVDGWSHFLGRLWELTR